MLKPLHYHTLIDIAHEILTTCMKREETETTIEFDFDIEEAVEVTKRHLPTPFTKDQMITAIAEMVSAGSPGNSCAPFKLAFTFHHLLIEDCEAEVH